MSSEQIQQLKKTTEDLKKKYERLKEKCPAEKKPSKPSKSSKPSKPSKPFKIPNIFKWLKAKVPGLIIDSCDVPKTYFGKTDSSNVNCKLALQDQITNDRTVSKILVIVLAVILPFICIFYGVRNSETLQLVHYILFFVLITLSIITLTSMEGLTIDKSYIVYPKIKDCNSCKFNGKLPLIGILCGGAVSGLILLINYIIQMISKA